MTRNPVHLNPSEITWPCNSQTSLTWTAISHFGRELSHLFLLSSSPWNPTQGESPRSVFLTWSLINNCSAVLFDIQITFFPLSTLSGMIFPHSMSITEYGTMCLTDEFKSCSHTFQSKFFQVHGCTWFIRWMICWTLYRWRQSYEGWGCMSRLVGRSNAQHCPDTVLHDHVYIWTAISSHSFYNLCKGFELSTGFAQG